MKEVFVIDALRTPIGKYGGALASVRPDDMLASTISAILERNATLDLNMIEDVIAGDANQAGEDNRNVARMAALLAGLPVSVAGTTVNRLCASGLQAIMDASRAIMCGEGDLYIACGVESMTRAPFVMAKADDKFARKAEIHDSTIGWRFINQKFTSLYHPFSMGETAENVARKWGITREAQDIFALSSQQKYFAAKNALKWDDEIIPLDLKTGIVKEDEHPRQTTLEKLSQLKPAFAKDGTVTAGNSSGINDGAAAMLLASAEAVSRFDLKPLARVVSMGVAGVHPDLMGIGPVPSTQKALKRAGLGVNDIGLVELNEAFASQSLACIHELGLDASRVNVNGGSIALGHPLGCSGVRISTTLIREMKRAGIRYGLASMCVGVGQGGAVVFERM